MKKCCVSKFSVFFWALLLTVCIGSFFTGLQVRPYITRNVTATIVGKSMMPTLVDGERFDLHKPTIIARGDIVVFTDPIDGDYSGKRVIGLGGDIIEFHTFGTVYVNGELLDEPYLYPNTKTYAYHTNKFVVPTSYVFVLGDNRNVSADSREYGTFPQTYILGKIIP